MRNKLQAIEAVRGQKRLQYAVVSLRVVFQIPKYHTYTKIGEEPPSLPPGAYG